MRHRLYTADPLFEAGFRLLLDGKREVEEDVRGVVTQILSAVRARGDVAVLEYTERFDRQTLTPATLRFTAEEIDAATALCARETVEALGLAAARIEAFHRRQPVENIGYTDEAGVFLGARWRPVSSVGLYVPGGTAAYPSSVLMNAIPAKVAGVERLVMVVPTPGGQVNPLVLAAAKLAGVTEIYRIGGAQAVGALAYGTATIAPVDKIVGPGNAFVAEAKRQVFGVCGIDMIAGPSEILVVADAGSDPAWIAADLLSQAEHDANAQSILITDNDALADRVAEEVKRLLATLDRAEIARESWNNHGGMIVVQSMDEVPVLVDRIAPEHLELAVAAPAPLAERVRNAGAIFMGRHTPEAIGDYVAGPNHVLPTSQSARFSSGLNVLDFMKRTTLVSCSPESLERIGPAAVTLAKAEGLQAHARSVTIRLERKP